MNVILKLTFVLFFFSLFISLCSAQDNSDKKDIFTSLQTKKANEGTIRIYQDSSLQHLIYKYMNFCETAKGFPGYRIRIFSDSGTNAREKASHVKNKFSSANTEYECYLTYKNPNFEIHVGDFRTKSEALKLLKSIQGDYPSAFIVKAMISYPK